MPLILGTNSIKDTTFNVANSLRFNRVSSSSGDSLERTPSSAGNRRTFTFSCWFKLGKIASSTSDFYQLFGQTDHSGSSNDGLWIDSNDRLYVFFNSGERRITNQRLKDPLSWYHVVLAIDTTQSTASSRIKLYLNGSEITSFSTNTDPTLNHESGVNNTSTAYIGERINDDFFDGYMAEVVMIDGQQLDPTSFGEFDSDSPTIWKPKDVRGLTFGTNGFYLDFENASSLGADVSGNSNNFTVNNLTSVDQSTDTCTNNYAVWNGLQNSNGTLSEGNLKYITSNSSSNYGYRNSSFGVSSGRWYAEIKYTSSSNQALIGIRGRNNIESVVHYIGYYNDGWGLYIDGKYYHNAGGGSSAQSYGATWTNGDIIGIYLDCEDNKLYFSKNGAIMNSGTGISITDPNSVTDNVYYFSVTEWNSTGNGTFEGNFGGTQSFTVSSGNTDANGYGNFEYSPNDGGASSFDGSAKNFYALNTKNLAEFG